VIRQAREEFLKQELPQLLQAAMELHKVAGPVNAPAIGNKQSNAEAARRHQKWKTAKNADDLGKMKEATFLEGRLGSVCKNGQLLGGQRAKNGLSRKGQWRLADGWRRHRLRQSAEPHPTARNYCLDEADISAKCSRRAFPTSSDRMRAT
jgi:hypothetical protein